jgi:choline monooxygenase
VIREGALSPRFYSDPDWFTVEREGLARGTWQFFGLTDELAADGDWLRKTVLGTDVFVQNFDGNLRGYRNVCSHRGFPLRQGDKGNGAVQCGFHGWVYDREGVPTGIPRNAELFQLDREGQKGLALSAVRVETVGRFVFVTLSAGSAPVRDYLGAYAALFSAVSGQMGEAFFHDVSPTRANWKLCVEITLDDYHPQVLHPTTLGAGEPLKPFQCYYRRDGIHSCLLKRRDADWTFESYWSDLGAGLVDRTGYKIHHVFPNVLLSFMKDWVILSRYEPEGPGTTRVETTQCAWSDEVPTRETTRALTEQSKTFLEEDRSAVQALHGMLEQKTRADTLGALEERIVWFHDSYRRIMGLMDGR